MDNNTVLSMDNNNNNEEPNKQWIARLLRRSAKHLLALVITVALLPVLFYDDSKVSYLEITNITMLLSITHMKVK